MRPARAEDEDGEEDPGAWGRNDRVGGASPGLDPTSGLTRVSSRAAGCRLASDRLCLTGEAMTVDEYRQSVDSDPGSR